MSILATVTKQVAEVQQYSHSFTSILANFDAVTISTSNATVSPSGLTVSTTVVPTEGVDIRYSVGIDGIQYKVTIVTTLSNGLVYEDELYVTIKDL